MKVGVLIEFTSNTDIDAKFAELKEMGVDSCQLVCWDRPTLQDDARQSPLIKVWRNTGSTQPHSGADGKAAEYGISMKDS